MTGKEETGIFTLYSDVEATAVRWLWYPFIAVGKITLLQGDPGDGKSTMMMNLIAELSKGGTMPDGKQVGIPQKVIYQCSEDDASDTIKPRLETCGTDCRNVAFINEEMGLKDVVVSASPEGILVSDKEQSSYIKPFVNTLDHRVMFAEKSWGSFKVIDIDKASMTIKVTLNAGHQMNYHSRQHRDEVWTVIAGEGKTVVDGMEQNVKAGDVITMSAGCRHTIIAETELKLIEVQLGEAIDVHDKQKFELEY